LLITKSVSIWSMKKGYPLLVVVLIVTIFVLPSTSASDRTYDGTIIDIIPDSEYPVTLTYYYSRRRNKSISAFLSDELDLKDLGLGMAVKWRFLDGGHALIVGPIPDDPPSIPDDPPGTPDPPSTNDSRITEISITVENDKGETLSFSLNGDDWHLEDGQLRIDSPLDVSEILYTPVKKMVMFLTHIPMDSMKLIKPYLDESKFRVWMWNYVFPDFPEWGDYFNYETPDAEVNRRLREFKDLGFYNVLYVDVTECHRSISDRWGDSVIESRDWWSLMTLDPQKSWYRYLKAGMLDLVERFPTMDGFAIDRLDRCRNGQEEAWAAQLLDEVKQEAQRPIRYVMNTLQPWMTDLASRAAFIGSDGMRTDEPYLSQTLANYENLASYTELGEFYINPWMGQDDETLLDQYNEILSKHDFVFIDDFRWTVITELFP